MKKFFSRLSAAALVLALLCTPAFALTPQQAGELLNLYYVDEVPQRVLEQSWVTPTPSTSMRTPINSFWTACGTPT